MSDQVDKNEEVQDDENVEIDDVNLDSFADEFDEDEDNFGLDIPSEEDDDSY
ncbi:hypothetical protein KC909_01940 [Candidatus Dojkabacteria bacterium]|uniref:Uncharacterized protein n=1 Tax=Candidatus Dojkabacteria bacterium TaxID=2099670 RepID=A0A955L5N3_9BACT|nr:hypothetical protein [Candidatus Dojkabacteria bacterium]